MQPTPIEYLDQTWNPIAMRCTPVSAGCDNCWHLRTARRLAKNPGINPKAQWAYSYGIPWLNTKELAALLRRKKPAIIGVEFMGDLFHESIPYEWIASVYGVMAACPQHTFVILTKRPKRRWEWCQWFDAQSPIDACAEEAARLIPWLDDEAYHNGMGGISYPLTNVIEGVSVENQPTADERLIWLLKTPAAKRVLSYEPALGPIQFRIDAEMAGDPEWVFINALTGKHTDMGRPCCDVPHLDGVICGAETGPGARPMDLDWARSTRDQCQAAGVKFFFKRDSQGNRELDGRRHEEVPW